MGPQPLYFRSAILRIFVVILKTYLTFFMKKYKNIIFDLGRVLLRIAPEITVERFKQLGISDFEDILVYMKEHDLFDNFERGKISPDDFISALHGDCMKYVTKNDVISAWNAMLLDFPKERIELLQSLSKQYSLFLLSNTNSIHYQKYHSIFEQCYGFKFNSLFTKAYYSHEMGERKPDARIFEMVLEEQNLKKEETLFLDDNVANLAGATRVGIATQLINDEYTILDFFCTKKATH